MPSLRHNEIEVPASLKELVDFLGGLSRRAPIDELRSLLTGLDISSQCLERFAVFGPRTYRRNLICEGTWFELLCICWRSGQQSPIHNHAGSTCGLRVMQGTATETIFEPTASGLIKVVRSHEYTVGSVCSSQDQEIHQISNHQAPGNDLMTLHIYSPPLRCMETYSLTDNMRQVYAPVNGDCLAQDGAAGISGNY
jgi:cysteine dioxygenase